MYLRSIILPMDIFGFALMIARIRKLIADHRVTDALDFGRNRFGLILSRARNEHLIAVSVSPDSPMMTACSLSTAGDTILDAVESARSVAPKERCSFTRALAFHLEGAKLGSVDHPAGERRVELEFIRRTEFGKEVHRRLIIEIMGRHSGAFIIGDRRMVISIARKFHPSRNAFRRIETGRPYPPPPPLSKPSAFGISNTTLERALAATAKENYTKPAESVLPAALTGIGREFAGRLLHTADISPAIPIADLLATPEHIDKLTSVLSRLKEGDGLCEVLGIEESADPAEFYFARIAGYFERKDYTRAPPADARDQRQKEIERAIKRVSRAHELDKLGEWLMAVSGEADEHGAPITNERRAEALKLADELGISEAVGILLAKSEPPEITAGYLFKKAERYRLALPKLKQMLATAAKQQPAAKEPRRPDGESAEEKAEFNVRTGKISAALSSLRKLGIRHRLYTSSDGIPIVLGLNAKANDALLKKYGSTPNWWFHARDVPGSWVIALTGKSALPDRARIECAIVAAAHSQDKDESRVEVSFTQMKFLRKPKKAKPGTVLVRNEKSVTVDPAEFARIKDRLSRTMA